MNTQQQIRLGLILLAVVGLNLFLQRPAKTSALIETCDAASFAQAIASKRLTLIDFYADWCAPCRAQQGALNKLAAANRDDLLICKLDYDRHPALNAEYGVEAIPTLILFREGRELDRVVGRHSFDQLQNWIDAQR